MTGWRQLALGIFMAFLLSALVLGSLSLSLLEGGYTLAEAPTAVYTIAFSGERVVNYAGTEPSQTPSSGLVIYTPTALACNYPAGWVEIDVSPDNTLNSLAQAYQVSVEALKAGNCMNLTSSLIPGSLLRVPPVPTQAPATATLPVRPSPTVCQRPYGWVTYIVRPGDTLAGLAASVQMTAWSLQSANCLSSAYIFSGQALAVPYYPIVYPTATYRPPVTWPTSTYGPSPTFAWLPSRTPTPQNPPLTTWTPIPGPSDTPLPPPPPSDTPVPPPTEPPPTLPPPPSDTPVPPPTEPPPTLPPPTVAPPTVAPPTEPPPTLPPPPTEPLATVPVNGYPFP